MVNKSNKSINSLTCVFIFIALVLFFPFEIYTFGWHLFKENPVRWKNLIIKVPKDYIADVAMKGSSISFRVRNLIQKDQPTVFFTEFKELEFTKNLIDNFGTKNSIRLDHFSCKLLSHDCHWFKLVGKSGRTFLNKDKYYSETIFWKTGTRNYTIVFSGRLFRRSEFIEILDNLKLASE